ncbi:hypothetical protein BJ166DRAFT_326056 [Pestalotiopsis sp. NC0098]|nr:hypothetical protein BJ166DRAFT_326056 [Pestalotiopsis sp. NC0098]
MLPACGMQSTCSYSSFHGTGRSREIYCAENKRISAETIRIAQTWAQISSHISSFPFPFLLLASPLLWFAFWRNGLFFYCFFSIPLATYSTCLFFFFSRAHYLAQRVGFRSMIGDWGVGPPCRVKVSSLSVPRGIVWRNGCRASCSRSNPS